MKEFSEIGLLESLNRAFADEWLAYYQYWIEAKVVKSSLREAVLTELLEHAEDELRHADMLAERIMQLHGTPILKPEDWYKMTTCGFKAPEDHTDKAVVQDALDGELCAINTYSGLLRFIGSRDDVTSKMIGLILKDEETHRDDLKHLLEKIAVSGH